MRRSVLLWAATLLLGAGVAPAQAQMLGRAPDPDLNRDGVITAAEYRQAQVRSMTGALDKNKDGQVTRAEFKPLEDMARRFRGEGGAKRAAAMWDQADADRNGVVTTAEIQSAADRRFARADKDGDGRLDKVEFTSLRQSRASGGN
ncbi:MAG: hypothetical protein LPJ86_07940 [Caulobacteraceae bacterium]|nr:hypothetical protein [Caulobacteraceae bacterium]